MTVNAIVIARLVRLYGPPTCGAGDTERFFDEYRKPLSKVSDELLQKAIDRVVEEQEGHFWPTVGTIVAATRTIAAELAADQRRQMIDNTPQYARPDPETRARVNSLVKDTLTAMNAKSPPRVKFGDLPPVDREAWETRFGQNPGDWRNQ